MKSCIRKAALAVLRPVMGCLGSRGRALVREATAQQGAYLDQVIETIPTRRGDITFYCLDQLPLWRARTLLTKEPETIEWIDRFQPGDVYWDVGANVGVYALYAAIRRDVQVLAFEPSAANYILLNRNIELNRLSDCLQAYCLAFSDKTTIDALNMQTTAFGGALSSFGVPVDNAGQTFVPSFRQGMIGFTIDDFMRQFAPPFPNHLKIDVDGIEDLIIVGAGQTLADPRLKSLSIELDAARPDYTDRVVAAITAGGLELVAKRHGEMFDSGAYKDIYNYQFQRPGA
jgi:FkbM family methyltransferase